MLVGEQQALVLHPELEVGPGRRGGAEHRRDEREQEDEASPHFGGDLSPGGR